MLSIKKVKLVTKLEDGTSMKQLIAEFGVGTSTIYGLEPRIQLTSVPTFLDENSSICIREVSICSGKLEPTFKIT
jgi:hypothetical protein